MSLAVAMKVSLMSKSRGSPPQPVPFLFQAFYYDLDKVRLLRGWNVQGEENGGFSVCVTQ